MKKYISAGIVVYRMHENKREYLLLQHSGNFGHWDFPKGKVEANETLKEAAHRELLEEAGVTAKIILGFQESFTYFFTRREDDQKAEKEVTFFIGSLNIHSSKVVLSHEHVNYVWQSYEKAMQQLTYKNAKNLLQKTESYLHNYF